jgi:hypothetical protein
MHTTYHITQPPYLPYHKTQVYMLPNIMIHVKLHQHSSPKNHRTSNLISPPFSTSHPIQTHNPNSKSKSPSPNLSPSFASTPAPPTQPAAPNGRGHIRPARARAEPAPRRRNQFETVELDHLCVVCSAMRWGASTQSIYSAQQLPLTQRWTCWHENVVKLESYPSMSLLDLDLRPAALHDVGGNAMPLYCMHTWSPSNLMCWT